MKPGDGHEAGERVPEQGTRRGYRILGIVAVVAFNLAAVEWVCFAALEWVIYPRDASLLYRPDEINREAFDEAMQVRHPILGWPLVREGRSTSEVEARPVPSFPDTDVECVSTYGDSYTFGDEVEDADAWANRLSELLGCRVGNFGMSGYGTDQAYLRARLNQGDDARATILGIYPYNLLRNVNQYRRYLAGPGSSPFSFKPRFVIHGDSLRLVSIPSPTFAELLTEVREPGNVLRDEEFLPGSASGPPWLRFPYTVTLGRLLLSDMFLTRLSGRPSWTRFLNDEHPSRATEVTVRIATAFAGLAGERGQKALILIFPTLSSYEEFVEDGDVVTTPLVAKLERAGLTVLDLHEPLRAGLQGESYCALLVYPERCAGHYGPDGSRLVAEILFEHLTTLGYLAE